MKWNFPALSAAIIIACLMAARTTVRAQMFGDEIFSMDSLTCASSDIVEGRLAGDGTAGKIPLRVIHVEITAVHKGPLKPGQVINAAFAYKYSKHKHSVIRPLDFGDELILFLDRGPSPLANHPPPGLGLPILTSEEYYQIAPSGMRLVLEGRVKDIHRFHPTYYVFDMGDEGGKTELPTREAYVQRLDESVKKTEGIMDRFKSPAIGQQGPWLLQLMREQAKNSEAGKTDFILMNASKLMVKVQDLAILDESLWIPLPRECIRGAERGFATAEGRDYLFQKIADGQLSTEKRVRYAEVLRAAVPIIRQKDRPGTIYAPIPGEVPVADYTRLLLRTAREARAQSGSEPLCVALLRSVNAWTRGLYHEGWDEMTEDMKASLGVLRELYYESKSGGVKFQIERCTAKADPASYEQLDSNCRSILSFIEPVVPPEDEQKGLLHFAYEITSVGRVRVTQAWIVLDNMDTHRAFVLPFDKIPTFKEAIDQGATIAIQPPEGFEHGRYRGHLEFELGGKVISTGHGFEAKL